MTISEIIEFLILGIITGSFATVAPVLFGKAFDAILGIIRMSSN